MTRKVFFYSILTAIPFVLCDASVVPWGNLVEPAVVVNFLLLSLFSSLFGYVVWNTVLERLGTVLASNYIYAIPLVTIVTAVVVLGETITGTAILGAFAIVTGMILAEWKAR